MQYCSLQIGLYFHHQSHPQLDVVFALALSLHSFWSYFSILLQWPIGHLPTWGVHLSVPYLFAFSSCSWGSQGKNNEVVCHCLLQWTTFCQSMELQKGWAWLSELNNNEVTQKTLSWSRLFSCLLLAATLLIFEKCLYFLTGHWWVLAGSLSRVRGGHTTESELISFILPLATWLAQEWEPDSP